LAAPVVPVEFWRSVSPDRMVVLLVGAFTRAHSTHLMVITVDEIKGGEASQVALVRPLDLAGPDPVMPPGSTKEPLSAAEYRWQVESALRVRDEHDRDAPYGGRMDLDQVEYATHTMILRSRLALLPEPTP
jgi:hypothetical protein